MKVGDIVRTKRQPWMGDDYDDTEYGFIVKMGVIFKIDDEGSVWVRHSGGLPFNEGIRLFYHFEVEQELEVIGEMRRSNI